ncbi:MAG TPA: 4Fe-4S dicluster domain-containing protein [Thermoplasmata archaeon]|nr:4Fe-4S dicluster domain-containing protein [Thermoplasmata archaeon]HKZ89246.1 4Fe-4S dicluster domain-containing protein [Thermoplasmata archaeon]
MSAEAAIPVPASVVPDSPSFWREVASTPGGEAVVACIQCNTCTSSCPVEILEPAFRIRQVIARVRLGLREDVLSDPSIWSCVRCYACVAHCPKHVRPGDVIEAIRHIALEEKREGPGPRHARAFVESVRENGRIHEAGVTFDSIGFRGLIGEGLLPLEMAWRGKSPAIRRRPLKSVREIQTLLDVVEESE